MAYIEDGDVQEAYDFLNEHKDLDDAADMLKKFAFVPTKAIKNDLVNNESRVAHELFYDANGLCTKHVDNNSYDTGEFTYVDGKVTHIDIVDYNNVAASVDFVYDADGTLAEKTAARGGESTIHQYRNAPDVSDNAVYDDRGNMISDGSWFYEYDDQNRLVRESGDSTFYEVVTTYAYNEQGLCVELVHTKTAKYEPYEVQTTVCTYVYDARGNCIEETVKEPSRFDINTINTTVTTRAFDKYDNMIKFSSNANNEYLISWKLVYYPNGVPNFVENMD
ncbi:MAG: hypothetical protein IKV35_06070, partial [Clostridia bacterium]|nr:hypothetical protein [Clostridia bacterium]